MVPIKYNVRSLIVRKRTTLAAAVGLALAVAVFACALMLAAGLERTLGRAASPDVAVVMRKGSDTEMTSTIDDKHVNLVLSQAAQIGASKKPVGVGEVLVVILLDKIGVEGVSNVTVRGVPEDALAFRPTAKIVEGRAPNPGSDEVVVGRAIKGRFKGLTIGESFELKKNRPVKVVGFFSDDGSAFESEVWADVHVVRQAFGRTGAVSSVRVRLDSPSKFDAFKALVEGDRQLGLVAMREADYFEKQSQATGFMLKILGGMVAFFVGIGAMIGATITMNAQVAGRSREIGTLRALGFSKGAILFAFLLESLVLALVGGIVGAVAALGMTTVKLTMLNMGSWSEVVFGFEASPQIIVSSVVLSGIMGLLGGFLPAIRAARVSPIEAMRG
ncbi:MAG TPA: FtsX-like permease family protein [Labilithrix sp.]|nr:FtsX-like permease family protein [Labilithrix sp.]